MKKILTAMLFTAWCSAATFAQYNTQQNMAWVFGGHAGISFATGTPVPFTTNISTGEGSASVCDAMGNLLFYTDGQKVWNSANALMPSVPTPSGIVPPPIQTNSATQAAVIVPFPGVPGKYYIFSIGANYGSAWENNLYCTVVDMSLAGGMGDVVTSGMATMLASNISEKMIAVAGDSCNVWLITHKNDDPIFQIFKITPLGISAPVTYTCGTFSYSHQYFAGVMKASPNRRMLVTQCQYLGFYGGTQIYDFDPAIGVVSNCRAIDTFTSCFGAEFSPDNTKLYSCRSTTTAASEVCQYDVSLPSTAAIIASRTTVGTCPPGMRKDAKLAPDNKIYINNQLNVLSCITSPNVAGVGCGFVLTGLPLGINVQGEGLPNTVVMPKYSDTTIVKTVNGCTPEGEENFVLQAPTGSGMSYTWHNGSTASVFSAAASGTYWVVATNGCNREVDTFHVTMETLPLIHLGNDTTINTGGTIILTAPHPAGSSLAWSTGSSTDTIHVHSPGTYWATLHNESCSRSDTIIVHGATGIASAGQITGLSVSPNPAQDNISIAASSIAGGSASIQCYNAIGIRVASWEAPAHNGSIKINVPVRDLPPGLYTIRIEDMTGNYKVVPLLKQ